MEWNFKDAQKWAEDKESPYHDAAVIYVETHSEYGAKPNVSKWFDYCNICDIHPEIVDGKMPSKDLEDRALRYRMGRILIDAKRFFGKGYFGQSPKTLNAQKLANDYSKEYYNWVNSLTPEDRKMLELISKGITDTRQKAPTTERGDIRQSIQMFVPDIAKIKEHLKKFPISSYPAENNNKVLLHDNGKKKEPHIPGSVWGERLGEAYWIIDELLKFDEASLKLINNVMNKPIKVSEIAVQITEKESSSKLIDLSPEFREVGKSLGLQ